MTDDLDCFVVSFINEHCDLGQETLPFSVFAYKK